MSQPEVSVLIATRNRAQALRTTLLALVKQFPGYPWEIIVVVSGGTDETPQVLTELKPSLPLVELYEPRPGKSLALNQAIGIARGRLLVFTDDDVSPSPKWISELVRAATEYKTATVFCGPITPQLDRPAPDWLFRSRFAAIAFAIFIPPFKDGPLPAPWLPLGPNFAIRASAIRDLRFREDLGPSAAEGLMCEDVEYMDQFRRRGDQFVFVPTARVSHRIRSELLDLSSLMERAFMLGRSQVIWKERVEIEPSDEMLVSAERAALLNYCFGQVWQYVRQYGTAPKVVMDEIESLEWDGDRSSLSRSAFRWLSESPEYLPESARDGFHTATRP
jgi:glycosyltransferase involved in cell wall biosynthesis